MNPLLRAGLRFHARRPAQLALCVAGVALGVAVVAAMSLAIDSSRRAFDLSNESVFGHVTHTVEAASSSGMPEALYLSLREAHRDVVMAPVVEGDVYLPALERGVTLVGLDLFSGATAPRGAALLDAGFAASLMTEPDSVVVSADSASRFQVDVGDELRLLHGGALRAVTVVGVLRGLDELQRAALDGILIADIATAQEVLGQVGRITRIDLEVPPAPDDGTDPAVGIGEALPDGVRIEVAAAAANVRREMTRAFYLNLRMLSLLALLVGLFIVYNALTFSVVQRRELIGTLRAVGVTGREVLVSVLAEAALIGAVATAIGLAVGIGLAGVLLTLVSRTIDDLYFASEVSTLAITPAGMMYPVLLGIAGSVLAALLPALEATRIAPRAAMTASHLERVAQRWTPRLAGVAVCAGFAAVLVIAGGERSLAAAFVALFLVVVTATVLSPAAIVGLSRLLEPLARLPAAGVGLIAVRGLRRGLSRSAVAVAALMVALSAGVGVATMVSSFRVSLETWLYTTLAADVYVAAPGRGASARLPGALPGSVSRLPGVRSVSVSRDVEVNTAAGPMWLKATNVDGGAYRGLTILHGEPTRARGDLEAGRGVLVSEPLAWRAGLRRGDRLTVDTDRGSRDLWVAGVFRDYSSDRGMILMGLPQYRRLFADDGINALGLELDSGADVDTVSDAVRALAGGFPLQVRSQSWIRQASLEIFDRTFAITRVLQWLAVLVAGVGVLSALMALALERGREIAILRAQGMTGAEVLGVLQLQTGCMGLVAGLLSLPLGLLLALILVHVINRRAFGWGMSFHVPLEVLAQSLLLAVVAALLAGLYPAWRLMRTPTAVALRQH